jgi:hypothetical protein
MLVMIQYLQHANPARIWLREQFQTSLRLVSGRLIVIRFDLASCGREGIWDADKIMTYFDPTFLVDKEDDYGEYLSIASTVADVLNQRMELEAAEILAQIKISFSILDALRCQFYRTAYAETAHLAQRLLPYDPRASQIWSSWIDTVFEHIKSDNEPGYGLDTLI